MISAERERESESERERERERETCSWATCMMSAAEALAHPSLLMRPG
jgi:hypothetical protein